MKRLFAVLVCLGMAATTSSPAQAEALGQLINRFAPVELKVDLSPLSPRDKQVLSKLIKAGQVMDQLFLRQAYAGNEALFAELSKDHSPDAQTRLDAFLLNKGPWDRLNHFAPLWAGVPARPESGNFYPVGASKEQIEHWLDKLPTEERTVAAGFYSTIRQAPEGGLQAVPYSVEYRAELEQAAKLLNEAAALTDSLSLRSFLHARAAAFLNDDYYASDVAWMKLNSKIDPTIGPYEVYEDGWFNAKAAFESFIGLRDDGETQKLARFSGALQDIENHLPIPAELRNPKLGALAPITVVNEIFCSGDANHGVQTAAFNLPNDERIEKEMGTKRVMLKNVQEAKFAAVLQPIAEKLLAPEAQKHIAFDAFFTHILMHELMHGLGPHEVHGALPPKTVRAALQSDYSAIEEAKADIAGLFAMQYLIDKGTLDRSFETTLYPTYLASMFRSIRFGAAEAHGKANALELNFLLDKGAVLLDKGKFSIDTAKFKSAVTELTGELMLTQARGDKARADKLLSTLGVVRPQVVEAIKSLEKIPVDIRPKFVTAESLLRTNK